MLRNAPAQQPGLFCVGYGVDFEPGVKRTRVKDLAMMKTLLAAALIGSIASPASAHVARDGIDAAFRSYAASDAQKAKGNRATKKAVTDARVSSPYSPNPEYDVYVRGEYVGSDPDPRVRWTLRDEARRHYGSRD
jgi:hypothetical protein